MTATDGWNYSGSFYASCEDCVYVKDSDLYQNMVAPMECKCGDGSSSDGEYVKAAVDLSKCFKTLVWGRSTDMLKTSL